MDKQKTSINLVQMALYILKRIWLVAICAAIGFGFMYWRSSKTPNTYTATGTMFVTTNNPNLINYGYTNTSDLSSAVQLVNVYSEVIKSEVVTQDILGYRLQTVERDGVEQDLLLSQKYPELTSDMVRSSITMKSVNETPMVRITCTTRSAEMSKDICEAVLQIAPKALKDVVGAGDATALEFPNVPRVPNARQDQRKGLMGALAGAMAAMALLAMLFLLNRRVEDADELTDKYTPPVLASVRRIPGKEENLKQFVLGEGSSMDLEESYAKLRMNLLYTLVDKERKTVLVTSAISGEGKSTIAANLAISLAMSGKRVLLMDADMRRACQSDIFHYDSNTPGLSDVLIGQKQPAEVVMPAVREKLDVLPAGTPPPNPSELLESDAMQKLLKTMEAEYDIVLLDAPPINIVSDPLALSSLAEGGLFVVRQHFSDHREIRKALIQAEMTGLELLGFVFYGEKIRQGNYYSRKSYRGYRYYHRYDTRARQNRETAQKPVPAAPAGDEEPSGKRTGTRRRSPGTPSRNEQAPEQNSQPTVTEGKEEA